MEIFTTLLWLCAFIGICVSLFYIYERSSLMMSRQYHCPLNLLEPQLIGDGLMLGKYFGIFLFLLELGSIAFYLKGVIVSCMAIVVIANVYAVLYIILNGYFLKENTYLREVFNSLRNKWGKGENSGEFYNDEVNLYRTIRDCYDMKLLCFLCITQLLILILFLS